MYNVETLLSRGQEDAAEADHLFRVSGCLWSRKYGASCAWPRKNIKAYRRERIRRPQIKSRSLTSLLFLSSFQPGRREIQLALLDHFAVAARYVACSGTPPSARPVFAQLSRKEKFATPPSHHHAHPRATAIRQRYTMPPLRSCRSLLARYSGIRPSRSSRGLQATYDWYARRMIINVRSSPMGHRRGRSWHSVYRRRQSSEGLSDWLRRYTLNSSSSLG